jgi:sugar/nucleoside kinase (ribokinase family)
VTGAPLDVLAVGDVNPDLLVTGDVVPRFGQVEQDVATRLTLGGSAAIFAAGTARLGLRTAIAATIGDDDLGRAACALLVDRGVDVSALRTVPARTTGLTILLQHGDDRAMLTDRGVMTELDVEQVAARITGQVRHVHLASLFLVPGVERNGGAVLAAARRAGATVSVDTNYDPAERFAAPPWLREVDVLLPNATEALALAGRTDGDLLAAARDLAAGGALVVVKRGGDGALAVRGAEVVEAAAPPAAAVDAVGAGDSFDAGFVRALLDGLPLAEALRLACACGSLSLRAAGGIDGQATLEEARALSLEHAR